MGRVYTVDPGPNERSGMGYRFFTHTGEKLSFVTRVAFAGAGDGDEGVARVATFVHVNGLVLTDPLKNEACQVEFTTWVRAVPPSQPDPPLTPNAVLYKLANGSLKWFANDPLPDEAIATLNASGAATPST